MATLLENTFEGGTDGVTVSAANSGGASGDAFDVVDINGDTTLEYDATRSVDGGLSALFDHSAATANRTSSVEWAGSFADTTDFFIQFYVYMSALPLNDMRIVQAQSDANGNAWDLQVQSTGNVRFRDGGFGGVQSFTNPIGTGYWVRFAVNVNASGGSWEIRAYNLDNADGSLDTLTESYSGVDEPQLVTPTGRVRIGVRGGDQTVVMNMDNITTDDAAFPAATHASAPAYVANPYFPNMGSASRRYADNQDPNIYPNQGSSRWGVSPS